MIRTLQPGEVAKRLVSPGFFLLPPAVRNPERMPEATRRAQLAQEQRWFPPRAVRLSVLENVYVAGEGLVFTAALDVLDVSVREHTADTIERFRLDILRNRGRLAAERLSGTFLQCRKPGMRNYGHWLTEMLPCAWLAREHWPEPFRVMVHAADPPLRNVVLDTLQLAGFRLDDVWGVDEQPFRVERLLVVDGLTEHGTYMSPLVTDCLQDITAGIPPGTRERILVVRRPGSTRRFAAEADVARAAEAAGFLAVDPGTLPFAEQVSLFKGARKVSGALGAGMTNMVFALPGSEIVVAAPGAMSDTFFWFLAGLRGLRFTEVRCPAAAEGWDGAVALDAADQAVLLSAPVAGAGRDGNAALAQMAQVLDAAFDADHYRQQRGTGVSRAEALLDYLEVGWRLGLDPSAGFGGDAYLLANEDVARAGLNPLVHYVRYGAAEGRAVVPPP